MDSITTLLAGGMNARLDSLDLVANNLSNASTNGYQADRERFNTYLSADLAEALAEGEVSEAGEVPVVEDRFTEFRTSTPVATGLATDVALDGDGFFSVETPRGVRYTRAGRFRLAPDGELRTREGYRVRVDGTRNAGRLAADPAAPLRISAQGEILQGENTLGTLARVGFGRPDLLSKEEAVYFRAADGMKEQARQTHVISGSLESSNVDAAASSFRLVEATRQFALLNRALTLHDGLQRGLIERVAKW